MLGIFPSSPNCVLKVRFGNLLATREVTSRDLGIDLNPRIRRDKMVGNIVALEDGYPALHDSVVFPIMTKVSLG